MRGEVERLLGAAGIVAEAPARAELAEDLTSRVIEACVPLLPRDDVPEHVRALTSPRVLAVESDLTTRLTTRAAAGADRAPERRSPESPATAWTRRSARSSRRWPVGAGSW